MNARDIFRRIAIIGGMDFTAQIVANRNAEPTVDEVRESYKGLIPTVPDIVNPEISKPNRKQRRAEARKKKK